MDSSDYTLAWIIYLCAATVVAVLAWFPLKRYLWRELAYLVECLLLALLYTPWYVLPDQEILAPALMVFMLDTITIDSTSGIRALIPLVMAMLLGLVVTVVLSIIYRVRQRHQADSPPVKK